jgi:hypothetical protein
MALLRLLRRRQRSGHPLFVRWYGSAAVLSHPGDSPLVLWQLLRNAAGPGDDVLIMASDRAMNDRAGGAALRAAVEHAAKAWRSSRIWVAADGIGRPRGAHAAWLLRLAARSGVELLAPDGPVHATPDGTLYAATGTGASGWRSFRAGGTAPLAGRRHPLPRWERALPDRPVPLPGLVADPIPAGVLLRATGAAPVDPEDPAFHVPVDPSGPALVLRNIGAPPIDPAHVAELFAGLPPRSTVHVETRLFDLTSAPPRATWLDRLAAELTAVQAVSSMADPFAPLVAGRRSVGDGPGVVKGGWVRIGERQFRHQAEAKLLAEVVPSGIVLRAADARGAEGSAFVAPDEGVLTVEAAASDRLVGMLCRALAARTGYPGVVLAGDRAAVARLAEALDPSSTSIPVFSPAPVVASALPVAGLAPPALAVVSTPPVAEPDSPVWMGDEEETEIQLPVGAEVLAPLPPRLPSTVSSAHGPSVASWPGLAEADLAGAVDPWADEVGQAADTVAIAIGNEMPWPAVVAEEVVAEGVVEPPPVVLRPPAARTPVITVSGPDLDESESEPWPATERPSAPAALAPDVLTVPPAVDVAAVTLYRPAAGEPVPDRASTADERRDFVTALGPAYTDSITTVNAALAAWPALRQDSSPAAKTDLVAVRLLFGRSGPNAPQVDAGRLRAGQAPELPGFLSCLVSGLRRLPPSRRAMLCQGRLTVPAQQLYPEGAMLVEPAFRVVSGVDGLSIAGADIDYLIWSRSARQAGLLGDPELDEAVFLAGTRFKVLAVREGAPPSGEESALPGVAVLLREVLPGEPAVPGLDDADRATLTRLDRALARRRTATPKAVDDGDAIDRLIGPPLGFVEVAAVAGA